MCIQNNPDERYTIDDINKLIDKDLMLMKYFNENIIKDEKQIDFMIQYLYENICILKMHHKLDETKDYFYRSFKIFVSYLTKIKEYESDAFNNLGHIYYYGIGVEQNYEIAKDYYEKSANLNNSYGLMNLGFVHANGYGVQQNIEKALECYHLSASLNNSVAYNCLGYLYKNGRGVERNYQKAREYFESAAKLNNSNALYHLGHLYYNGYGVEKDIFKAKNYFELSAKLNNTFSLNALGFMYESEKDIGINYSKAIEYYEKAAKLKSTDALLNLFHLYADSNAIPKDEPRAKNLLKLAENHNNPQVYLAFGKLYEKGNLFEQDYIKAKEQYELAANLGQMDALHSLGNLYFYGKGVEQNYAQAKYYYELASEQENQDSLFMLGLIYEKGLGIEKNISTAKKYYELGTKLGDYQSYFKLGTFCINDENIDVQKAIQYFTKCTETNGERFSFEKNGFYNDLINCKYYPSFNELGLIYLFYLENHETAIKYFKQSLSGEYPPAQNNYGLMCQFYLNKINDAEYIYRKASKNNFSLAEYNLGYLVEKEKGIDDAIEYYINASKHENEQLIFHAFLFDDEKLKSSKTFVILLADLKLFQYFWINEKEEDAKSYFMKVFTRIKASDENDIIRYIKEKILEISILVEKEPEEKDQMIDFEKKKIGLISDIFIKSISIEDKLEIKKIKIASLLNEDNSESLNQIYDIIRNNYINREFFCNKINEIIRQMESVLYKPPYSILFGQAQTWKSIKDLFSNLI